jgi:hypothetical protein
MRSRNDRQNASINDAQLLRAVHSKLRVDNTAQLLRHHRTATAGVAESRRDPTTCDEARDSRIPLSVLGAGSDFDGLERRDGFAINQSACELKRFKDSRAVEWVRERVVQDDWDASRAFAWRSGLGHRRRWGLPEWRRRRL